MVPGALSVTKGARFFWLGLLVAGGAGVGVAYVAQPEPSQAHSNAFLLSAVVTAVFAGLPYRAIVWLTKLSMRRGWQEPAAFRNQVIYLRAILYCLAVFFLVGQFVFWVRIGRL